MTENNEGTITIKKDALWKYSTFALLAVLVIGGIIWILPNNPTTTGNAVVNPGNNVPTQPVQGKATIDDDAVLGNANAPVTIIEFSDYQCPFCGRFWSETLPSIKKDYIDTGKVKLVFRDLPLVSIHPFAQPAAEAVECVGDLGGDEAYYKMHDKVFENQASLSTDNLKAWAKDLGYDISSCLDSGKFKSEVQKDMQDAAAAGVRGTPGFIVMKSGKDTGTIISGAQPYEAFKQIIDSQL